MTQQLLDQIKQLSLEERLELIEVLTRSISEELRPRQRNGSSLSRVRGLLKPDGPLPSDDELQDAYTNHLLEKYS